MRHIFGDPVWGLGRGLEEILAARPDWDSAEGAEKEKGEEGPPPGPGLVLALRWAEISATRRYVSSTSPRKP